MITKDSVWTLAMCTEAAQSAAACKGFRVDIAVIEGSWFSSVVRFEFVGRTRHRYFVAIDTRELEDCSDGGEVGALVHRRVSGVLPEVAR